MTIFACFMILMFLMIGGIGVDLMRNEMERVKMQNTADRAVLAAADMEQTINAREIVIDYFAKSGLAHLIKPEDVVVDPGLNFRRVSVNSLAIMPTTFMKMVGITELPLRSFSEAEERVPNIEISLVLDISGSMEGRKMNTLRPAAAAFIDTVMAGGSGPKTSVTLVPYAGQTNPGPFMFNRLNGVRYAVQALDEDDGGIPEAQSHGYLPAGAVGGAGSQSGVRYVFPNVSSCIDVGVDGFGDTSLPEGSRYNQTPHFMNWRLKGRPAPSVEELEAPDFVPDSRWIMDWGWCPHDRSSIKYLSNDREGLKKLINNMKMHDGTGTHYAMKWAVAMLDDTSQADVTALISAGQASAEFEGRPAAFDDEQTTKYIVLMTDGAITEQFRPRVAMDDANPEHHLDGRRDDRIQPTNAGTNIRSFEQQCELAKSKAPRPIIIYTIAFSANGSARSQMRGCASSPAHFFRANEASIASTFQAIARQINQLRLTQ